MANSGLAPCFLAVVNRETCRATNSWSACSSDGELKIRALLHRDGGLHERRGGRTVSKTSEVFPWVTAGSDIEAYLFQKKPAGD